MAVSGVTPDDVATGLGRPLSAAEENQAFQWIDDAELVISARLGSLALLDGARLAFVVREAVIARLRNPEGLQSESIDDYTKRLPSNTRQITILDDWWGLLSPANAGSAYTISVSSPLDIA